MTPTREPVERPRPEGGDGDLRSDVRLVNYKVEQLGLKLDEMRGELRTLKADFATKAELKDVQDDVNSLRDNIGWAVKIVLGLVLAAVVGLVLVRGGVPRP